MSAAIIVVTPAELAAIVRAAVRAELAARPSPERLPLADAAARVGVGRRALRDACRRGELSSLRAGRAITVAAADLETWAASRSAARAARPAPASGDADEQALAGAGLRRGSR